MATATSMYSHFGCAEQDSWCWAPAFSALSMQPFETSDVLLQKVPGTICESSVFMDAMLEQAGLEETLVKIEVLRKCNQVTGELIVTFSSQLAAQLCVQTIDGALWSDVRSSGPVRARLLAEGGRSGNVQSVTGSWRRQQSQEDPKDKIPPKRSADTKDDGFFGTKSDASDSDDATTAGPEPSSRSEDTSDDDRQFSPSLSPSLSPSQGLRWADISDSDEEV